MASHDRRPDPDALIEHAAAEARGRLKIFLGAAPGVGKTWEMLVQARRRQSEGVDVLCGVVETHGRAGTEAELKGLPMLPLREVSYRGQVLREFDMDAALARRPALLLVDELAHTNAPGSRHAKRWEDVAALIAEGINVWATLNVQHLESLNDDIARMTGVRVTETLPDQVLDSADEIELIDVPPAELRQRLAEGRIYRPDTARRALDGFFKEGNLASLREVALRRAAAHVDDDVRNWMRRTGMVGAWPSSERVLALIGPNAAGEVVVRAAKRLSDALHAPWAVLHVERAASLGATRVALGLAEQLGAEVITQVGDDLLGTVLDVGRKRNATHIVLGRGSRPFWQRLVRGSLASALLNRAPDVTVLVVPMPDAKPAKAPKGGLAEPWWAWPASAVLLVVTTAMGALLSGVLPGAAMGMIYLAVVVASAAVAGMRLALVSAVSGFLLWDYFFIPPLYEVTIGSPQDLVGGVVFLIVAVVAGGLAGRVRGAALAAQARVESLRRVGAFSRRLGQASNEADLLMEVARQACELAGRALVLSPVPGGDLDIRAAVPNADTMDEGAWAAARWCWSHSEPAGRGTGTLPGGSWRFLPLRTVRGNLGVLGVRGEPPPSPPTLQAIAALADSAAIAWERVVLAQDRARSEAMQETQRLRTSLMASLGHDLRTPLTGIGGAAGTLRVAWDKMDEPTRSDLLASIEQDVARMAGFLANITDMTRLESGQVAPRLGPVQVEEVVEAAVSRLPPGLHVSVQIDPALTVRADPTLLEQALFNVLENAVKYAPAGSLVSVRAAPEGSQVAISVADAGIGIPPDDLTRVFDSFFRAGRGDRGPPGTGLGLAIAHGLLEAMGGTILAQSPRHDLPADGLPGTIITLRLAAAR